MPACFTEGGRFILFEDDILVLLPWQQTNGSHQNLHNFLLKECALLTSGLFTNSQCLLQETRLTNVQQLCHEFVQLLFLMRV